MSLLIFTGDRNTPGKKDFTGAFLPESERLAASYPGPVRTERVSLGLSKAERYRGVVQAIRGYVTTVAFLCHGSPSHMQLGITKARRHDFCRAVNGAEVDSVVFYTCLCGEGGPEGEESLADDIADLCPGVTVYAHTTAGHTTRNPYVRVFRPQDPLGGEWVVAPGSELWKPWVQYLRGPGRFTYWREDPKDLERQLRQMLPAPAP